MSGGVNTSALNSFSLNGSFNQGSGENPVTHVITPRGWDNLILAPSMYLGDGARLAANNSIILRITPEEEIIGIVR